MTDRLPVIVAPASLRLTRAAFATPLLLALAASCSTSADAPRPGVAATHIDDAPAAPLTPSAAADAQGTVAKLRAHFSVTPAAIKLPQLRNARASAAPVIGDRLASKLDVRERIEPQFDADVRGAVAAPAVVTLPLNH